MNNNKSFFISILLTNLSLTIAVLVVYHNFIRTPPPPASLEASLVQSIRDHWQLKEQQFSGLDADIYGDAKSITQMKIKTPAAWHMSLGDHDIPDPRYFMYLRKDVNNPLEFLIQNQHPGNRNMTEIRASNGEGAVDVGVTGPNFDDPNDDYAPSRMRPRTGFIVAESPLTGGLIIRTNGNAPIIFGVNAQEAARIQPDGTFVIKKIKVHETVLNLEN